VSSVSIWCRGPAVRWSTLAGIERLAIVFRKNPDDPNPVLLESIANNFGECGLQLVELDLSDLDDIWPDVCPVCGTDGNWDMEGFYKTYPQYKSSTPEEQSS